MFLPVDQSPESNTAINWKANNCILDSIDDFSDNKKDAIDKKKTKVSKNEPEIEIERSYERIKFNAEIELNETNTDVTMFYEKNTGKNIDFSV